MKICVPKDTRVSIYSGLFFLITLSALLLPRAASAQGAQARALAQVERDEPTVAAVRRQVLRAHGWADPDLDDWSSRARWSHLLPELKGEVAWLDQQDIQARYREDMRTSEEGLIFVGGGQNNYHNDSRLRSIYAVTVKWKLSGLIYDTSEPRIASEVSRRQKARRELLVEVGEIYFARRQFQMEFLLTSSTEWRKRLQLKVEVERSTARLDALSEGWFSAELARIKRERDAKNTPSKASSSRAKAAATSNSHARN